jgi:hypothetical protein
MKRHGLRPFESGPKSAETRNFYLPVFDAPDAEISGMK